MPREVSSLADILADARVWKLSLSSWDASAGQRLGERRSPSRPVWSTGRRALDARLPGGGWAPGALIEVLLDAPGLGEVQLFLPALVQSQRTLGEAPWLV